MDADLRQSLLSAASIVIQLHLFHVHLILVVDGVFLWRPLRAISA